MTVTRPMAVGALALLCALAAFPYLVLLGIGPVALDSAEWIARGATFAPDWHEWVFGTRHFGVGYRPVTALSFTINQAGGGFEPAAFRGVDIALHVLGGILVYALYCAMAHREERRRVGGLIAAALFLLHPAAQDVLPILARRSYLLANVFSLAGLFVLARSICPGSSVASRGLGGTAAGLLLATALFSNESGAMSIVVVPVVAAIALGHLDWREILGASGIPLGIAGFAVALRLALIGGTGGYALSQPLGERVGPVIAATWRSLAANDGSSTALSLLLLVLLALGIWHFVQAARSGIDKGPSILLLGGLWLIGTTLLYASQGVWYPRQGYLLIVPFALVVAYLIVNSTTWTTRAPWLLLCAILLAASPATRGLDDETLNRLTARHDQIESLRKAIESLSTPADVQLVIPFTRGKGPVTPLRADVPHDLHRDYFAAGVWLSALRRADGIRVRNFLFYETTEEARPGSTPMLSTSRAVQLNGRAYRFAASSQLIDVPTTSLVPIERSDAGGLDEYLLILGPNSASLHEL